MEAKEIVAENAVLATSTAKIVLDDPRLRHVSIPNTPVCILTSSSAMSSALPWTAALPSK